MIPDDAVYERLIPMWNTLQGSLFGLFILEQGLVTIDDGAADDQAAETVSRALFLLSTLGFLMPVFYICILITTVQIMSRDELRT